MSPEIVAEGRAPPRPLLVTALLAALLGAATLLLLSIAPAADRAIGLPLTMGLSATFFLAEGFTVHIPARRDSHTISLVEIPLVLALSSALPGELLAARLVGSGAALLLLRRQVSPLKVGFNLSTFAVETAAAMVVYLLVAADAAPTDPTAWLGIGAALITFHTVGALAVSAAIWINDARPTLREFVGNYGIGLVGTTMAWAWGLVTIIVVDAAPLAAVPLLALAAGLYLLLGVFGRLRRRHEDLKIVHSFTTALDAVDVADELPGLFLEVINGHFMTSTSALISKSEGTTDILVLDDGLGIQAITSPSSIAFEAITATLGREPAMLDPMAASAVRTWTGLEIMQGATVPILATQAVLLLGNPRPGHAVGVAELNLLRILGTHAGSVFERHRLFGALATEVELRQHQALHDSLTNLPNRTAFLESVDRMLQEPSTGSHVAVLLLDLNDFKAINDTLSHRAGDQVLIEVAARLENVLRSADIIARVGGDEYAAAIRVGSEEDAAAIARRVKVGLHHPFISAGLRVEVGASIGIAVGGNTAITMLRHADIAMYAAKDTEAGIETYREEIDDYDAPRLKLAGELRPAIEAGQVKVYYQPKIRACDGSIAGFEALARWDHPAYGIVSPLDFVPIAERTGLMVPLTEHVLATALMDASGWRDRDWTISVNFSPRTLATSSPARMISDALDRTGVEASRLVVEVTESAILPHQQGSGNAIAQLHELGVAISIDDFGTGYSSMSRLRALPIGELKIDHSFISDFEADFGNKAIVETTLTLAQRLGLKTVAEGVMDERTLEELRRLGVDEIQGFYYSPALPIDELWDWIDRYERRHGLRAVVG